MMVMMMIMIMKKKKKEHDDDNADNADADAAAADDDNDYDDDQNNRTQLGIDGCRCGNAAYLIVVIEVIGVFKASTLYVSGVPCSSGSGGNISGCIVAYTRWRVFSRVRVAV
ncbi:hypothetical protein DPMN_111546 [Dreissena polymorpha]|uniref:Uncharacterized protein n=1 Tax=Dreissena polymorpha TaxID=45954 RepID=A0A9D4QQ12_DREPO|nr:hypothetical protein DPMN_111546 [Dreissena polymorpha]